MEVSTTSRADSQVIGVGAAFVKTCPSCGIRFTLKRLLEDPEVVALGMQFDEEETTLNLYYFNHVRPGCGSTFVVPVLVFLPLIEEPIPDVVLAGTEVCKHHCLSVADLAVCNNSCRYAPFRRFLLRMHNRAAA